MENQETDVFKNSAGGIIAITIILSFFYAILRYHIVGSVPWKDLRFFIFNKGIALSSFILLVFNFTFGPLNNIGIKVPASWLNSRRDILTIVLILPTQLGLKVGFSSLAGQARTGWVGFASLAG